MPFLKHIGIAAAWCFKHWPSRKRQKKRRGERTALAAVTMLRRQATVASQTHPSNCVMETRGLFWCCRCGARARRVPRSLRRPCVGAPRSVAYRQLLKRLRKGLLPGGTPSSRVDIALQKPARVQVQGTTSVVAAPIKPQESRPQSEAGDAVAKHVVTEKQPRSCGRKTVTGTALPWSQAQTWTRPRRCKTCSTWVCRFHGRASAAPAALWKRFRLPCMLPATAAVSEAAAAAAAASVLHGRATWSRPRLSKTSSHFNKAAFAWCGLLAPGDGQ